MLRYGELFTFDARGEPLVARLAATGDAILLLIDDRDASYPIYVDPLMWLPVVKLIASDAAVKDYFGYSVGISSDTAIVGAWHKDVAGTSAGSAYVFGRNQGGPDSWGEIAELTASDAEYDDRFGISVAISGDTPNFALPSMESPVRNESRTPGSGTGRP